MSCQICASPHPRLPFLCPTCARNRLYQLRLETTHALLDKEALGRQIETVVTSGESHNGHMKAEERPSGADHHASRCWALQTISSQQAGSSTRKEDLARKIEVLKNEIQAQKANISERRALLSRRRSDAGSAQYKIEEREVATLASVQNTTKRTEHIWHSLHTKTAEARIFLCREAAHLYGLRQKTTRKGEAQPAFVLGSIPIVDLREMNGATPAQISTSLSNIARLLVLVSHYLSLRLPAEVVLPHRNWPTPAIYAPTASYHSYEAPYGGSAAQTSVSSPTNLKATDVRTRPRPRPLFIDKPLPRLAKEDPGTYALFLEGVTLLAWNVAWLCRTQGINLTSDSWEEVCDIGKSMWQLLVAPPAQTSTLMRAFAGRDTQSKIKPSKDSPQTTIQRTKSFPVLGHYSHGTVHSFLSASEGSEFIRTWKLPTPTKIADKLKASLLGEMASAEWELLEEKEWDDGAAEDHPSTTDDYERQIHASSNSQFHSNHHEADDQISAQRAEEVRRPRGTSGWTKLNSR